MADEESLSADHTALQTGSQTSGVGSLTQLVAHVVKGELSDKLRSMDTRQQVSVHSRRAMPRCLRARNRVIELSQLSPLNSGRDRFKATLLVQQGKVCRACKSPPLHACMLVVVVVTFASPVSCFCHSKGLHLEYQLARRSLCSSSTITLAYPIHMLGPGTCSSNQATCHSCNSLLAGMGSQECSCSSCFLSHRTRGATWSRMVWVEGRDYS